MKLKNRNLSVTNAPEKHVLSRTRLTIMTLVSIATLSLPLTVTGQGHQIVEWHTGKQLDRFNELALSAWWTEAEFGDRLRSFSQTQKIAIFLDRRIDPSIVTNLSMSDVTKEQFLWTAATQFNVGVCRIEDFYYFGPPDSVATFPEVCKRLQATSTRQRRNTKVNWTDRQPLTTADTVEPKKLLLKLAKENQFAIKNIDSIPHDIWAGFELPGTTLQVRVAILLVGFGMTFERNADGSEIEIINLPTVQETELTFKRVENSSQLARALRAKFPNVKISVKGKNIAATGPPSEVAAIQRAAVMQQIPRRVPNAEKTITITNRASRGTVLATIAQRLNANLSFDKNNPEVATLLRTQIEINAVHVSLEEIIVRTLDGTNLEYEIANGELRIREKE